MLAKIVRRVSRRCLPRPAAALSWRVAPIFGKPFRESALVLGHVVVSQLPVAGGHRKRPSS